MLIVMKVTCVGRAVATAAMCALVPTLSGCGSGQMRVAHQGEYVIVPALRGVSVVDAYDRLHALGLKLQMTKPFGISSLVQPSVRRVVPRPGSRVMVGSTVKVGLWQGPIGSPAVLKSDPQYVVPSFRGKRASAAAEWADAHGMFWSIPHLSAVVSGMPPRLLDGYRIVAQRPEPGQMIQQGVRIRDGFRPTPLTLVVVRL